MEKYRCKICGYIYNEELGDPQGNIAAGTSFADLPESWVCPICGARKDQFEKVSEPIIEMEPIGPLMIEHRLIEKIILPLKKEITKMEQGNQTDTEFLRAAADFFHVYADLIHHGKEESILFAALKSKNISSESQSLMDELLAEHEQGRENVKAFISAIEAYAGGDQTQIREMISRLNFLLELYPRHIKNEDEIFFPGSMEYFSAAEQSKMLKEMKDFDEKMPADKYVQAMKLWEGR